MTVIWQVPLGLPSCSSPFEAADERRRPVSALTERLRRERECLFCSSAAHFYFIILIPYSCCSGRREAAAPPRAAGPKLSSGRACPG